MRYLFIDRKYVQRIDGIRQIFHQPVKEKRPVLAEARSNIWVNAPCWCEERSRWCIWYPSGEAVPVYAESRDGLNWERLPLVHASESGSMENAANALYPPYHNMLRDDNEKDPARRFKGLTRVDAHLAAMVSPDGMDWTPLEGDRIPSGDQFKLNYDGINHRFVATVKLGGMIGEGKYPVGEFGRAVSLSISDDFVHWSDPELVFWGDEIDQENGKKRMEEAIQDPNRRSPLVIKPDLFFTDVYNMPVFDYEDIYLGLPTIFNQSGRYWYTPNSGEPNAGSNQDGILYPSLAASRDLYNWDRLSREPFIPLSPLSNKKSWDYSQIYASRPVKNGDELWFYYAGSRFTHLPNVLMDEANLRQSPDESQSGIFVARMRMDGFASLYGGAKPGVVLTTPITVTGSKLYVNVNAARGELRAELRDASTGRVIPGYSLGEYVATRAVFSDDGSALGHRMGTGYRFDDDVDGNDTVPLSEDSTAVAVRWNSGDDLTSLVDRKVRICFCLRNAHLYSFWFGD